MAAPYRLYSPNGRTLVYFVATEVTGPVISYRVRDIPTPQDIDKIIGNIMTREEKVTLIARAAGISTSGEETGVATGANQAAAEAATPAGTGRAIYEALRTAARTWPSQAGGRTRGAAGYPNAAGVTTTGEVTLVMGTNEDGSLDEYQGVIENITPNWLPRKGDQAQKLYSITITFRIGKVQGA